jgi:hypothetical protein
MIAMNFADHEAELEVISVRFTKGLRRAAAFVSIAVQKRKDAPPSSLSLEEEGDIRRGLLPEKITVAEAAAIQSEFFMWSIGNALAEADQCYYRFLAEVWKAYAFVNPAAPACILNKSKAGNSAARHRILTEMWGFVNPGELENAARLMSLVWARNCLAHNSGIVDAHKSRTGGLFVKWAALELIYENNGVPLPTAPGMLATSKGPAAVAWIGKEKFYAVGERIDLTPGEVLKILSFYQLMQMEKSGAFLKAVAKISV